MKKYKYELHAHEKTVSRCATISPEELVLKYRSLGYDGIVVTNHFVNGYCLIDRNLPWEEQMNLFYQGYENVKKYGDKYNLKIFFGIEYNRNYAEFLIYGLDKQSLIANPNFHQLSIKDLADYVEKNSGIMFQAHPFRDTSWMDNVRVYPKYVKGFEIVNAHNSSIQNNLAISFNEAYKMIGIAGSDTHSYSDSAFTGIETETEIKNDKDLVNVLKEANFTVLPLLKTK